MSLKLHSNCDNENVREPSPDKEFQCKFVTKFCITKLNTK